MKTTLSIILFTVSLFCSQLILGFEFTPPPGIEMTKIVNPSFCELVFGSRKSLSAEKVKIIWRFNVLDLHPYNGKNVQIDFLSNNPIFRYSLRSDDPFFVQYNTNYYSFGEEYRLRYKDKNGITYVAYKHPFRTRTGIISISPDNHILFTVKSGHVLDLGQFLNSKIDGANFLLSIKVLDENL